MDSLWYAHTMKIERGRLVRVEYELKVKGGEVIESSAKSGPIEYMHGEGKMLAALEKRLEGMGVGERKSGEIAGDEAFGPEDAMPTTTLPASNFPKDEKLAAGKVFEAKDTKGQPVVLKVIEVDGSNVKVRLIHPLAGKALEFKVRVVSIEDPATKRRAHLPPPPPPAAALGVAVEPVEE